MEFIRVFFFEHPTATVALFAGGICIALLLATLIQQRRREIEVEKNLAKILIILESAIGEDAPPEPVEEKAIPEEPTPVEVKPAPRRAPARKRSTRSRPARRVKKATVGVS